MSLISRSILRVLASTILSATVSLALCPPAAGQDVKIPTEKYLEEAKKEFDQQHWAMALEFYNGALSQDSRNDQALSSAAYCQLVLGRIKQASTNLERAMKLNQHDRSIVHNLAVALYLTDNPPRGLRLLTDYLTAHPAPLDEQLFNTLQYMIANADETTRKSKPYTDASGISTSYEQSLNKLRTTAARWGSEWLPLDQIRARKASEQLLRNQMDDALLEIARVDRELQNLAAQMPDLEFKVNHGWLPEQRLLDARDRVRTLGKERVNQQSERAALEAQLRRPTIAQLMPILPGATIPALAPITMPPTTQLASTTNPVNTGDGGIASGETGTTGGPNRVPRFPQPTTRPFGEANPTTRPPVPTAQPDKTVPATVTVMANGVAISSDLIVTTATVLQNATEITVRGPDEFSCTAVVARTDVEHDLALLRLKGKKVLPVPLAKAIAHGPIQCVLMPGAQIFGLKQKEIAGTCPAQAEDWKVKLELLPASPGAALLVQGELIGITLPGDDADAVPAVPFGRIARLAGDDLQAVNEFAADPKSAVYQIAITRPK